MSTITWNELKEKVEQELNDKGFNDDIEINYIDLGVYAEAEDVSVDASDGELTIY